MGSLAGDNKQQYIPSGFYKGSKVAIKRVNEKNINLSRDQMLELKKVNRFNFHNVLPITSIQNGPEFSNQ